MSKMSQLHAELSEQAYELGFESIGEAEQAGYGVDWENAKLIKVEGEQEKAHEAWLERKEQVLHNLETVRDKLTRRGDNESIKSAVVIGDAMLFIREGEV